MNAEIIRFPNRQAASGEPLRILEDAVVRLLKKKPFYGHLLLGFQRRFVQTQCGLGVTINIGIPILSFGSETLAVFSAEEQMDLLERGIKHLLFLHPVRGRGFHRLIWDVATGLAINPSIPHMPEVAPRPERYELETGLAAEEDARLLTRPFDIGNLEGDGLGTASQEDDGQHLENGYADSAQSSSKPVDDQSLWNETDCTL